MHTEPIANVLTTSDTNSSISHIVFSQDALKGSVCVITAPRTALSQII